MKTRPAIALLIAVATGALLFAENREKAARTLEERVGELESRVAVLEAKLGRSGPVVVTTERWRDLGLWRRRLAKGMSKDEVVALLGEPDKVEVYGAIGDQWHYGYPSGGTVSFSTGGRVDSWSEPHLK